LVIIGPGWLRSSDKWGRRRLDDPEDWVRREVCTALAAVEQGTKVVPVYLDEAVVPEKDALDASLKPLLDFQARKLTSDRWESDLNGLLETIATLGNLPPLESLYGKSAGARAAARPDRRQTEWPTMSDEDVRLKLEPLGGWQLQWGPHPWGVGGRAQEIARTYELPTFRIAIDFIQRASRAIETWRPPHHPRWENQWKSVTASFTTWDVHCRVTRLDIDAAGKLDELFYEALRGE
jgi:pterin-4a-carbinolamine dehydratase